MVYIGWVFIICRCNWLQPFIGYQGGKSRLAKRIVAELPPHKTYVEPMVGGGSVYFAKPVSDREVISDSDSDLMGFYRALKKKEISRCNSTPNKDKFYRVRDKRKAGKKLTPCEYLYLKKISFGQKGNNFNHSLLTTYCQGDQVKKCGYSGKDQGKYAERLKKTRLERGDFRKIISKYDSKDTVFYVDPPYPGTNVGGYLDGDLTAEEVKKAVDKIKGKLLLSYNNTAQNRKLFCGTKSKYVCKKVKTHYTLNKQGKTIPKTELLIKNFRCKITKDRKICTKL